MTSSLEDRLRSALKDAPEATVGAAPVEYVARTARRRRAAFAVATAGAVAAAVVAVVGLATTTGPSRHSTPPVNHGSPSPTVTTPAQDWSTPGHPAHGVAVPASPSLDVWVGLESRGGGHWFVAEQAPTGAIIRQIAVPGPITALASDAGTVWAYGGGDGGYPNGVLSAVTVATGDVRTLRLPGAGVRGITFVDGTPYVIVTPGDKVERLADTTSGLTVAVSDTLPGTPTAITATGRGRVWIRLIRGDRGRLLPVHLGTTRGGVGQGIAWPGDLLGAVTGNDRALWTTDSSGRLISLVPTLEQTSPSLAQGERIPIPSGPLAVVADSAGGLYVAVTGNGDGNPQGIAYYSAAAQRDANGQPTAFAVLPSAPYWMAADPHGGVVVTTLDFSEYHWDATTQ